MSIIWTPGSPITYSTPSFANDLTSAWAAVHIVMKILRVIDLLSLYHVARGYSLGLVCVFQSILYSYDKLSSSIGTDLNRDTFGSVSLVVEEIYIQTLF